MTDRRLITATGRRLSDEEVAFLAWFFVRYGRKNDADDGLMILSDWQEMTGQELPDDFLDETVAIYNGQ